MAEERAMRADARRNRDAIVAAARTAFDRGDQLRFDDFASRAGVGVGTLYRHFPTREALAAAVYQDEVTALCERARDSTEPAGKSLEAFLRGFVEYVVAHEALARTLGALVGSRVQAEGGSELERTVAELMDRAAADGAIREGVSSGAVMVVLHGIGSTVDRPLWASESRAAIELLINGITSR
ncbi:TetR/AcrR family transcriptional regulator [Microbacterium murale]|uniref:TetR family transcriptional regulator n=1 Tax=Microbacterium murale TaxID=1081040 RepID=A0ABQ1S0Y7_9MICO|nr:TetR/AcrR family transcriptional regulator [Microbacterium murale]GGD89716.1 TetR family transcriptional regulator [Microbacterium murale]